LKQTRRRFDLIDFVLFTGLFRLTGVEWGRSQRQRLRFLASFSNDDPGGEIKGRLGKKD
jgi:hypothetical protein